MVGEVRDKETADISMQASNTGHLVFSTIHTNSALSAITRLNDMGIDGYEVADNIIGIVSQSLLRKLCPHCKKKHTITKEDIDTYYADPALLGAEVYMPGEGCTKCNGTGYAGRTVAFEILEMTPEITNAIHDRKSMTEIEEIALKQSFVKKLDYAYELVRDGTTTLHEVSRVIGGITSEKIDH
jgi:type II secretory ATPase GspE/PulE/Tfp pilus assembly ATPase PilB-like protein